MVDFLKAQEFIVRQRKKGIQVSIPEDLSSPALDTIIHATRDFIQLEKIDIDKAEKQFLVEKIRQVMHIFKEEVDNPNLIL